MAKATHSVELNDLVSLFYEAPSRLGQFQRVADAQCPGPYQTLLAHDAHMTVTVERRHGCPVSLEVLDVHYHDTDYARRILLRRTSDQRVVQFGIVRLRMQFLEPEVREEVLARQTPLGRILIAHNVLRRVQHLALWKVSCGEDLAALFGVRDGHITYGRTAVIFCDEQPAIELLEIVAPEDTFQD